MQPLIALSGRGVVTIHSVTGVRRIASNNMVLNSFFEWAKTNTTNTYIDAICKIGEGATVPTTPTTTALEKVKTFVGNWPVGGDMENGDLAYLINSGVDICCSKHFTFTFTKGSLLGPLKEYGLWFGAKGDKSNQVHTRVTLDPSLDIILTADDAITIEYTLSLKATVEQPTLQFTSTSANGSVNHSAKLIWGEFKTFSKYIMALGVNYRMNVGNISGGAVNFTKFMANATGATTAWTQAVNGKRELKFPTTDANIPQGINFLWDLERCYAIQITPPIVKTDEQVLKITLGNGL